MKTEFINFLEKLSVGEADAIQWKKYIVTHYHDEELERVRVECVRLFLNYDKELNEVELDSNLVAGLHNLISSL